LNIVSDAFEFEKFESRRRPTVVLNDPRGSRSYGVVLSVSALKTADELERKGGGSAKEGREVRRFWSRTHEEEDAHHDRSSEKKRPSSDSVDQPERGNSSDDIEDVSKKR